MVRFLQLGSASIYFAVALHAALGLMLTGVPMVAYYWQIAILIIGLIEIIQTRDEGYVAATWAAYFAGVEVMLRMVRESLVWEVGKYAVVLFLLVGIVVSGRRFRKTYVVYFLLLVPSIMAANYASWEEARDMISFNLSGPLCLASAGIYFYDRNIEGRDWIVIARAIVLPIISMICYLVIMTPDLSDISFNVHSNFSASAGFGPNQVSLVLGVAIFFFVGFLIMGTSLTGSKLLDYGIISLLLFRALITFSRGGVAGAALSVGVMLLAIVLSRKMPNRGRAIASVVVILTLGILVVWDYANELTGDSLMYRYTGVNPGSGRSFEYTSGRMFILQRDFRLFTDNLVLGTGPGISKLSTVELRGNIVAAHTEWSRMLAEHGLFGLVSLLILFLVPLLRLPRMHVVARPFLIALYILSLFSMFHSAMRLAIIGFLYGLSLIKPVVSSKIQ